MEPTKNKRSRRRYDDDYGLIDACRQGDTEKVEQLLKQHNLDVNALYYNHYHILPYQPYPGSSDTTPLVEASRSNTFNVMKLLINRGADVNFANENGETALMVTNDVDVVQLLLELGANVNAIDKYYRTALMHNAMLVGRGWYGERGFEILQYLLKHGANVDVQDIEGFTALMFAVEAVKPETVEFLLNSGGANAELRNRYGQNLFLQAVRAARRGSIKSSIKLIEQLLDYTGGADIDSVNTALLIAVDMERPDIVQLLLQRGANPDASNEDGVNALNILFRKNQGMIDQGLLEDPDAEDEFRNVQQCIELVLQSMTERLRKRISSEAQPFNFANVAAHGGRRAAQFTFYEAVAKVCSDIRDGVMPPGELLALARLLEIPVSFETMSWRDICAAVQKALGRGENQP